MIELIKKIFIDSQFQIDDKFYITSNDYQILFANRTEKNKFDFYLIMILKEKDLKLGKLETTFEKALEKILYTYKYPGLDKNLSLLLVVEREVLDYTEEFSRKIYHFEEDPFYFKKYMLPYTLEQYDSLKKTLNSNMNVIEQLDNLISDKNLFSEFKESKNINRSKNGMIYDLISKIYIKLPFLKLKVNKEDLPNISKEINEGILSEDKEIVNKILNMDYEDIEWGEIQKVLGGKSDEL